MSDLTRAGKNHLLASAAVGGLLSGLFYSSAVLAFVFLVPIQICYGRRGQWAGLAAAVIALFVAVLGQFISLLIGTGFVLSAIQNFEMRQFLLFGILPPAVLLLSLVLMNAPFWTKDLDYARGFAGAAIASIAAIPGIVALGRDSSFIAFFEEHLNAFVKPLLAQAGNSFEASALQASFNAKALAQSSLKIISSSFSALFLALLAASWWLGNRMAGVGSRGQEEAPPPCRLSSSIFACLALSYCMGRSSCCELFQARHARFGCRLESCTCPKPCLCGSRLRYSVTFHATLESASVAQDLYCGDRSYFTCDSPDRHGMYCHPAPPGRNRSVDTL